MIYMDTRHIDSPETCAVARLLADTVEELSEAVAHLRLRSAGDGLWWVSQSTRRKARQMGVKEVSMDDLCIMRCIQKRTGVLPRPHEVEGHRADMLNGVWRPEFPPSPSNRILVPSP